MSAKSSPEKSDERKEFDYSDEAVDPRVQVELEKLNSATNEINHLEVDLDDARAKFRQLLCDTTLQVDALGKKLGSCIDRARPYYEARIKAKEALLETQKAAVRFERANSAHTAAKEMVYLAEEGLKTEGRTFDHAWQEMLNHATMRVNESETERTASEIEHRRTSFVYHDCERRVQQLQKDLKRSITKSRPYFELKSQYNQQLDEQKQRVKRLENQVANAKASYAEALRNLEQISDEIHKIRNHEMFGGFTDPLGVRGLGVGAESPLQSSKKSQDIPSKISSTVKKNSSSVHLRAKDGDPWLQSSCIEQVDSEPDEEFMSLPEKLGPAASPLVHKMGEENVHVSQYLGLARLSGNVASQLEAVAKLEEEVLEDAKTTRLEAERRPSLATSTPSCNTTPKKVPSNKFLPLSNLFEPLNSSLNGQCEGSMSQTWTAINLTESSSDNSLSPVKSPAHIDQNGANHIDIPYRPLLENAVEEKHQDNKELHVITPLVDEKNSNIWFRNSKPSKKVVSSLSEDGEDVWTEVNLNDEPETPTATSLFKKVSFFNSNFSCGRPRNSSTDDERRSSGDSNTPPPSARGSVSLHGTPLKQRMKLDSSLVNWISRSSAAGEEQFTGSPSSNRRAAPVTVSGSGLASRRQSLDTLLWSAPATERVKDILSHGMMMLNISSLADRRSSEPKTAEKSNTLSGVVPNPAASALPKTLEQAAVIPKPLKKVPSPLEKSLTYLNAEDDSASDTDSLHSMDMLTDEQITSFMLEPNLSDVCKDVLGTPINEVLPGYPSSKAERMENV